MFIPNTIYPVETGRKNREVTTLCLYSAPELSLYLAPGKSLNVCQALLFLTSFFPLVWYIIYSPGYEPGKFWVELKKDVGKNAGDQLGTESKLNRPFIIHSTVYQLPIFQCLLSARLCLLSFSWLFLSN